MCENAKRVAFQSIMCLMGSGESGDEEAKPGQDLVGFVLASLRITVLVQRRPDLMAPFPQNPLDVVE